RPVRYTTLFRSVLRYAGVQHVDPFGEALAELLRAQVTGAAEQAAPGVGGQHFCAPLGQLIDAGGHCAQGAGRARPGLTDDDQVWELPLSQATASRRGPPSAKGTTGACAPIAAVPAATPPVESNPVESTAACLPAVAVPVPAPLAPASTPGADP